MTRRWLDDARAVGLVAFCIGVLAPVGIGISWWATPLLGGIGGLLLCGVRRPDP